jgi:hypothetical protein
MVWQQGNYRDICIDSRCLLPAADSTVKSFNPFSLKGVNFLYPVWFLQRRWM